MSSPESLRRIKQAALSGVTSLDLSGETGTNPLQADEPLLDRSRQNIPFANSGLVDARKSFAVNG